MKNMVDAVLDPQADAWKWLDSIRQTGDGTSVPFPFEALQERVTGLFQQLADEQAEVKRLKGLIERDRTGLAAALNTIIREAKSRWWVAEGRGPYAWDDDEYKAEAGRALRAVIDIAQRALRESGDRVTAAFHPAMRKRCVDG